MCLLKLCSWNMMLEQTWIMLVKMSAKLIGVSWPLILLFNMMSSLCTMYIPCLIFSLLPPLFFALCHISFKSFLFMHVRWKHIEGANLGKKMYYFENKFNIILGVGFLFFLYITFWVQQIKWIFDTIHVTFQRIIFFQD